MMRGMQQPGTDYLVPDALTTSILMSGRQFSLATLVRLQARQYQQGYRLQAMTLPLL